MTTQLPTRRYRGGGRMAVTILAIAVVAACGGGSGAQTRTRASAQTSPSAPAVPPTTAAAIAKPCLWAAESTRVFRFKTSDGATLVGVGLGTGRTGLVLGHQLGSDLCEWLPQARAFARRGYRVLVFDFAGFGDSQPKRLLVLPGGGHGTSMVEFGSDAPKVLAALRSFIARQAEHVSPGVSPPAITRQVSGGLAGFGT